MLLCLTLIQLCCVWQEIAEIAAQLKAEQEEKERRQVEKSSRLRQEPGASEENLSPVASGSVTSLDSSTLFTTCQTASQSISMCSNVGLADAALSTSSSEAGIAFITADSDTISTDLAQSCESANQPFALPQGSVSNNSQLQISSACSVSAKTAPSPRAQSVNSGVEPVSVFSNSSMHLQQADWYVMSESCEPAAIADEWLENKSAQQPGRSTITDESMEGKSENKDNRRAAVHEELLEDKSASSVNDKGTQLHGHRQYVILYKVAIVIFSLQRLTEIKC